MKQLSSVLLGVDFSRSSHRAFEVAIALCARAGARLELLHVWNPSRLADTPDALSEIGSWVTDQQELLHAQLADWAAEARSAGVDASSRVVEGTASRLIPDLAREARAGLVIVGRRGSADLAHVLLGSVSERVVHLASVPVLVVPEETVSTRAPARLMVGIDFSDASADAFRTAAAVAEQVGASRGLLLAHVRPGEHELWLENWSELAHRREYPYDLASLEQWALDVWSGHIPVEARLLEGSPERCLVEGSTTEACDWLVLGLQGRTALASFLIGSTTDRCLKLADRPVLVVPASFLHPGEATS